jgi:hypothetical protein
MMDESSNPATAVERPIVGSIRLTMNAALSIWSTENVPRVLDLCQTLDPDGCCTVMIVRSHPATSGPQGIDASEPIDPGELVRRLRDALDPTSYRIQREGHDRVVIQRKDFS